MIIKIPIPSVSNFRGSTAEYVVLDAQTELHRIHQKRFGAVQFNGTPNGDARFSPLVRADGTVIPTIYAAQSFESAICEIILRSPGSKGATVNSDLFRDHVWSEISTGEEIKLLDLTTKGQRCIGVEQNALLAGSQNTYENTREWALKAYEELPDIDGIYYSSAQWAPEFAIMLFGDRCPGKIGQVNTSTPIPDRQVHRSIKNLATKVGMRYFPVR